MKKILLALTAVTLTAATINAQTKTSTKAVTKSGVYVQLHGGYGLGTNPVGTEERTVTGSGFSTVITDKFKKIALGQGINTGLTVGTSLSDNIDVEISGNYFLGSKQKVASLTNPTGTLNEEYSAKLITIVPALVLKTNNKDGANLYAKFGPSIGVGGKAKIVSTSKFGSITTEGIRELSKGVSIGIQTALGLALPISDKMSFIAEFSFRDQKISPQKGEITSYTENGADRLRAVFPDVIDREIDYVKEIKSSPSPDPNKPEQVLKSYQSLSSAGLNIGIRFHF